MKDKKTLEEFKKTYPEKFLPPETIFSHIHAGDRIFIGTGCGEPQFLVAELVNYVNNNPKAFFDAELIHIWTLGVAPYTDEKFQDNFRLDSFFVGDSTRNPVNRGAADYTPIFLSSVPDLFRSEMVPVDIALVQTSLPDKHGYLSLGISVDVVKAALEKAEIVVAQVNENMPRTHGDGFIHINDIDFILPHDEPLLEYSVKAPNDIVQRIGKYVARIIEDGSTIQVGYGLIPDEVVHSLEDKKDLGVHTELLS
ncbi:MAG: acetyl-CoA hydrolase, partial [Methanothrix sp.]